MKVKTANGVIKHIEWYTFSKFEKLGYSMMMVFFLSMLILFFVIPKI